MAEGFNPGTAPASPVTLVFTDVVGSSAAKREAALGADSAARDEAYLAAIQARYLRAVRECLALHGGREMMTIGDAFFLTFDDPRSALLCMAELQIRLRGGPIMTPAGALQLRIGIHIGTPQFFENSWHGTDVDMAARIEAAASPQQILLSQAACDALGTLPGVELRQLGTYALKGVGDVILWDADYDSHGRRKPSAISITDARRNTRLQLSRRVLTGTVAVALIVAAWFQFRPRPKLIGEKDKIVLADIENHTGDPVFDSTLKEALAIQLDQSPYLRLVSDQELRSDMRSLGHAEDRTISADLARQIGQREGIKAVITGSLSSLGPSYVLSLEAINCATGEVLERVQATSTDKPGVLTAVSTAATTLRGKLGESLPSVSMLSSPFMEVTASSLEAFHAFAQGEQEHGRARDIPDAEKFYLEAVDLDPNFAMAYTRLGIVYANESSVIKAIQYTRKAYDLRQRVTPKERLYIEAQMAVQTQNVPEAIRLYQIYTKTYPRDPSGANNLAVAYSAIGELEKAADVFAQAYALGNHFMVSAQNGADTFIGIDNLPKAKFYLDEVRIHGSTDPTTTALAYQAVYDFVSGDPGWRRNVASTAQRPDAFVMDENVSAVEFFLGHVTQAEEDARRGAEHAGMAASPDTQGSIIALLAARYGQIGDCAKALQFGRAALKIDTSFNTVPNAAFALALCGDGDAAVASMTEVAEKNPDNTLVTQIYLPEVKAATALQKHHPEQVRELLTNAEPYPMVSFVPYLQGRACLELKQPAEAIVALAPAIKWKGNSFTDQQVQVVPYPIGLWLTARAQVLSGNRSGGAASYRELLQIWKTADPSFLPARDALRELAALSN